MRGLTERQREVLEVVARWQAEHGYPPTVRELAGVLGIQVGAVQRHLEALQRKGFLEREPGKRRALRVRRRIPLVAEVPAGPAREVEEEAEVMEWSAEWFGGGELVAVRVRGDSMLGDAIRDGDVVIVRREPVYTAGAILAVRTPEGVTIKRVRRKGRWVELVPSNPEYAVVRYPAQEVEILGRVVGVVRRL